MMIDIALRRQKRGTGSSEEFMRRRTALQSWPDLREMLEGVDWVVVGDVATRAYMPERMTQDMDILVSAHSADEVVARFEAAGWKKLSDLSIGGFVFQSPDGVECDVLLGEQAWLKEAFEAQEVDPAGFPVISLPFLVLMKLNSGRMIDIADIGKMMATASDEALDEVRQVVGEWSPADAEDLESIIYLGKLESDSDE